MNAAAFISAIYRGPPGTRRSSGTGAATGHVLLKRDIAAWQQIRFLPELEGLVRMHRAQARIQLLLEERFGGVGDHHVGLAVEDLFEDGHVVGVLDQLRVREKLLRKLLVRAAWIDDGAHAGLIDLRDGLVFVNVAAADDRRLAVHHVRLREERAFLAFERARNATDRDIALRDEIVHQVRPRRLDEFGFDVHRLCEVLRRVDIDAFELAIRF